MKKMIVQFKKGFSREKLTNIHPYMILTQVLTRIPSVKQ